MRSYLHHVAFAAALLALPSCSLVVGGQEPIPCVREETNACPTGMTCIRGFCAAVECDPDGDGFGCGDIVDCDPSNENIYPGAMEICDGRDNDCNPATADDQMCGAGEGCGRRGPGAAFACLSLSNCLNGLAVCGSDQRCNPMGQCVLRETNDCVAEECTTGLRCNRSTGLCFIPGRLGEDCQRDDDCLTDHCFPKESIGLAGLGGTCSAPCCSSADCAGVSSGSCRVSGTGARGCIPQTSVDACVRNADCAGETCRVEDRSVGTFECGPPPGGSVSLGASCSPSSDCAVGSCVRISPMFGATCREPCGSTVDCPGQVCRFADSTFSTALTTWVTVCGETSSGTRGQGTICESNIECAERFCSYENNDRYCSNICCQDSQCQAGYACRPVNNNGWELRCLRE